VVACLLGITVTYTVVGVSNKTHLHNYNTGAELKFIEVTYK